MRAATNTSVASLGGLWERTMRTSTGPSSTTRSGVRDHGRTRGRCIHSRADIIGQLAKCVPRAGLIWKLDPFHTTWSPTAGRAIKPATTAKAPAQDS
jgi:hypothetical protein